jgi:hypothetical protein
MVLERRRRGGAWVLGGVGVLVLTASCGGPPAPSRADHGSSPGTATTATTGTTTAPTSTPSSTSGAPSTTSPTTTTHTVTPTGTRTPTLGHRVGLFASPAAVGFGTVQPTEIFNGGDPTGLVTKIVWHSWGGPDAVGTGMSDYVAPGGTVASGTEQPTTVVAFELGTCGGVYMYQAVEWYFAAHGQAFDPNRYEDVCSGTYFPPSP